MSTGYVSATKAAAMLGISARTLNRYLEQGYLKLSVLQFPGSPRKKYRVKDIEKIVSECLKTEGAKRWKPPLAV